MSQNLISRGIGLTTTEIKLQNQHKKERGRPNTGSFRKSMMKGLEKSKPI